MVARPSSKVEYIYKNEEERDMYWVENGQLVVMLKCTLGFCMVRFAYFTIETKHVARSQGLAQALIIV